MSEYSIVILRKGRIWQMGIPPCAIWRLLDKKAFRRRLATILNNLLPSGRKHGGSAGRSRAYEASIMWILHRSCTTVVAEP